MKAKVHYTVSKWCNKLNFGTYCKASESIAYCVRRRERELQQCPSVGERWQTNNVFSSKCMDKKKKKAFSLLFIHWFPAKRKRETGWGAPHCVSGNDSQLLTQPTRIGRQGRSLVYWDSIAAACSSSCSTRAQKNGGVTRSAALDRMGLTTRPGWPPTRAPEYRNHGLVCELKHVALLHTHSAANTRGPFQLRDARHYNTMHENPHIARTFSLGLIP